MSFTKVFSILLILIGLVLTSVAGYMDITGKDEINVFNKKISKHHLFSDGIYVTVLAIAILVLSLSS